MDTRRVSLHSPILLNLITAIITLMYIGTYPGEKISVNPNNWKRIFILIICYLRLVFLVVGFIMIIVLSIMFPQIWISPLIRLFGIVFLCFYAFFAFDIWVHLSFFQKDIIKYDKGWKVSWIIVMAWLTIILLISSISTSLTLLMRRPGSTLSKKHNKKRSS